MAKIKILGLKEVSAKLNRDIRILVSKALRELSLRMAVGEIVAADIRKTFKKNPAPSTMESRKYLEKYNQTHQSYKRNIINITFSGELLNDLAKNVKANTVKLEMVIDNSNKLHKKYKTGAKRGRSKGGSKRISNKELSEELQKRFDYMKISDEATTKIIGLIREEVFKKITTLSR